MSKNNTVPAFPTTESNGCNPGALGMTLRDYFIAHAPAQPQPWFRPVVAPKPMAEIWISDDGLREYTSPFDAAKKEADCFSLINQAQIDDWQINFEKQRYTQWPSAWADEMMKARQA